MTRWKSKRPARKVATTPNKTVHRINLKKGDRALLVSVALWILLSVHRRSQTCLFLTLASLASGLLVIATRLFSIPLTPLMIVFLIWITITFVVIVMAVRVLILVKRTALPRPLGLCALAAILLSILILLVIVLVHA